MYVHEHLDSFVNWHNNHNPFAVAVHKEYFYYSLMWPGIYCLQYKHPLLATWIASVLLAAGTAKLAQKDGFRRFVFYSIYLCIFSELFCCLLNPMASSKLGLNNIHRQSEHNCAQTKFFNSNPQSNFIQQPRIDFPKLWAYLWNSRKFAPRKNNLLYGNIYVFSIPRLAFLAGP